MKRSEKNQEKELPCVMIIALIAGSIGAVPVHAQGPTVNWEAIRSYSILAVKVTVTTTGILIFVSALIKSALAALRRQLGGATSSAVAQRELFEAIEGPLYWLIALAFAAWLPDILVAIGLLPQGTPFTVQWGEIFGKP